MVVEELRNVSEIGSGFVFREGGEDTERIGRGEGETLVVVGFGVAVIVVAEENDVVLVELVCGCGGGGVGGWRCASWDAEEAFGGCGFSVGEPVRTVWIHSGSEV